MGTPFPLEGCVEIQTVQDDEIEGHQHFSVSVAGTSPNNAVMISEPSTHVITIIDDDGKGIIILSIACLSFLHQVVRRLTKQ